MPGQFVVDPAATFAATILMSCTPRLAFVNGKPSGEQETTKTGLPRWSVECAVTFHPLNGGQVVTEILAVTVDAAADPAAGLAPGTPVTFESLRVGFSSPEKRDDGRIRGGRPWYQATAIHAANGHGARSRTPAAASSGEGS